MDGEQICGVAILEGHLPAVLLLLDKGVIIFKQISSHG